MTRKRLPLYCRAQDPNGKFIHLDRPLTENEGEVCEDHEFAIKQAKQKFFSAPVFSREETKEEQVARRSHWPFWP